MDWSILGIEPTKDKKAIAAAYRSRLVKVNPEDKPEEFKQLRAAYEQALALAEQPDGEAVRDDSPVGLWLERVRELYADFPARIRPEPWRELLKDEVCVALDKRPQAEEGLLRFLMEDYYLPQPVWQLLDEAFGWCERREELYESYPRDFVDRAVVSGVRYSPGLPYELFVPGRSGEDCDRYRRLYHRADRASRDELGPLLDELAALSEWHPYGQALVCRLADMEGRLEEARAGCRKLAEDYPEDDTLTMDWAALCIREENWDEGERVVRRVLARNGGHWQAKRILADCLARQGRYGEAKELIYELMRAAGGDQMRLHQLNGVLQKWNEILIERGEERLGAHPEDAANARELAWSYLQNDRLDDALRAARAVDPALDDPYEFHNLWGKLSYARGEYEQAVEHLRSAQDILRGLRPDGTEETDKRIARLPAMIQLEGSALGELGRQEEARSRYELALELAPDDPEIITQMARLCHFLKEYQRAVELLERLTGLLPVSYHGHYLLALNLFELGRDRDAFDAVSRALELEGGDLGAYVLKLRILLRNGVWEQARELLDFLDEHRVGDELPVVWCRARLAELGDREPDRALELYLDIARRLDEGEELPWGNELYLRVAVLLGEDLDADREEDREKLLTILDKGLAYDENDPECLDYKAWLLKRGGQRREALEIYHRLEKRHPHPLSVERALAELYYHPEHRAAHADRALGYYRFVAQREEHADLYFYMGTCQRLMGDLSGAEQSFLREQALAPDDMDGYNGLAYVYEAMGRLDQALEQIEKAVALSPEGEGRGYSSYFHHKAQILRRLGRPREAIQAVNEAIRRYGYRRGHQERFEIACQFGLWELARELLAAWKRDVGMDSAVAAAAVRLEMYRAAHVVKVRMALKLNKKWLERTELERLQAELAELEGDTALLRGHWRRRCDLDEGDTHARINLMLAHCWAEEEAQARRVAEETLHLLDDQLKQFTGFGALYRARRAMVLAVLGRREEARAQLEEARATPLCESCVHGGCYDADIFEAHMEELWGDRQRAMELYRAGRERRPDVIDFQAGVNRLTRKGKGH